MKHSFFTKWAIISLMTAGIVCSCGEDDPVIDNPTPTPDPVVPDSGKDPDPGTGKPEDYVAPTYSDNYTSYNAWTNRSKWQLANVHDPSVVLADDGYYYMYQTDASYGNVHDASTKGTKHGHFFCRRSKDMVNWEFLGATMYGLPEWVKDKHNEMRTAMGLGASTADYSKDNASSGFGFWAPCVRKVGNVYRMYYSINMPSVGVSNDKMSAASVLPNMIGMMETTTPSDVNSWVEIGRAHV